MRVECKIRLFELSLLGTTDLAFDEFGDVGELRRLVQLNQIGFDLYVDEQVFCYSDFSELVYRKLVQYVLKQRAEHQKYPIFITDLDLTAIHHKPRLTEYLEHKRSIEFNLERALLQLTAN